MPEARASTACEHGEAVVLAAASTGISRARREVGESKGFAGERKGCGRLRTALRMVRRRRSGFILTGRDRGEGKGKLMREEKENEGMYKLTNTTHEDRPALGRKDKSGEAERRKVVVIIDGAQTHYHMYMTPLVQTAQVVCGFGAKVCFDRGGYG
jgi:hypothetical protein